MTDISETTTESAQSEVAKSNTNTGTQATADVSREELMKRYDNTVADNAKYRQERKDLQAKIQELEAEKPEIHKQASERVAKAEFRALLRSASIDDPDALKLVPLSAVEYDDDGEPTNVAEIWTKFQEDKKYLFGSASEKKAVSTTSTHTAPKPKAGEIDFDSMSDDEFAAYRASKRAQR